MRILSFCVLFLALIACNNDNNTSLVKSETSTNNAAKKSEAKDALSKIGIEGFYTGFFMASRFDENKEYFDNKITIILDGVKDETIYGRSVVAGNDRPFTGTFVKKDGKIEVKAKEPGDNKYDGRFTFTIDPDDKKVKGTWTANDSKLSVTERTYELSQKPFQYDATLALTEDIVGVPLHGSFKNDSEQAEAPTDDAIKFNASTQLLKSRDIENMYKADLEVMRNAIYARHGYSFKNLRMRILFDSYVEWYIPVSTNVTSQLTEIEQKNIELIKRYEKHATKYYDSFGR